MELDTDDDNDISLIEADIQLSGSMDSDSNGSNPRKIIADAVAEVVVDGHWSVDFVEGGIVFTSNKTTQIFICIRLFLVGGFWF